MSTLKLLLNGEVYAPEALGQCHLLVAGGDIAWLGHDAPALPADLGAEILDLAGQRVVPGLVDGHVHLTGGGGEGGFANRMPPVFAADLVRGGTTTVVGVLGTDDVTRTPADLAAAARALTARGVTAYCFTGGYHLPAVTITGDITTDVVHVDPVIGVGEIAVGDHRGSQPGVDNLIAAAARAHLGGVLTGKAGIAHLHLGDSPRGLALVQQALGRCDLPARAFQPTHVNRNTELLTASFELAARGVNIDATAFPVDEEDDAVPAAEAVRRYLDAGLPAERLTVSSDAGGSLPTFDHEGRVIAIEQAAPAALGDALAALVAGGLALEQALPPFTSNPARTLRLDRRGVLRPGGAADLVVLDDNARARDVMAGGVWLMRNGTIHRGNQQT